MSSEHYKVTGSPSSWKERTEMGCSEQVEPPGKETCTEVFVHVKGRVIGLETRVWSHDGKEAACQGRSSDVMALNGALGNKEVFVGRS